MVRVELGLALPKAESTLWTDGMELTHSYPNYQKSIS